MNYMYASIMGLTLLVAYLIILVFNLRKEFTEFQLLTIQTLEQHLDILKLLKRITSTRKEPK